MSNNALINEPMKSKLAMKSIVSEGPPSASRGIADIHQSHARDPLCSC